MSARDWDVLPLGSLLRHPPRYGINAAAVPPAQGRHAYIRITDIDELGRYAPRPRVAVAHPRAADHLLRRGQLVFARTGASVGKSYRYDPADGELVYAGFLINVEPDPDVLDAGYLAVYVESHQYWSWVASTSVRSGQPGINAYEYAQLPIPLPELGIQRAIAAIARDHDAQIAQLERLIAKKESLKGGMMQQLLTGQTRVRGFDGPWTERPLGEIARVTMGQSPPSVSYNADRRGLPLLQGNADIKDRQSIERLWTTAPAKTCARGDVLLTVRAPVGYVGMASSVACLGRGVCALDAHGSKRHLFHALVHAEPRWLAHEQGSTFTAVNSEQIRSFRIALPDAVAEQEAIARVLDDADAEVRTLRRQLAKAKAVKRGMMQELLTGRTRLPIREATT